MRVLSLFCFFPFSGNNPETRLRNLLSCYKQPAHPLRNDPFAGYPTALLDGKASIALNPGAFEIWFKTIRHNPIVSFAPYLFLSDEILSDENTDKLLSELGECEIDTLLNHVPAESRGLAHRTVVCSVN